MADVECSANSSSRLMTQCERTTLLGCVACGGTLNDPVHLGGCLHSVCRKCLQDLPAVRESSSSHEGSAGVACPRCGVAVITTQHKSNHFAATLLRALGIACGSDALCDFCQTQVKAPADRWCAECSKCVCGQCANWHTRFNKDHATRAIPDKQEGGKGLVGGSVPCDLCAETGQTEVRPASCWCPECAQAMCAKCTIWHGRFQKAHGTTTLQVGDLVVNRSLVTAPVCGQHGVRFEFFCKTCDGLRCASCSKPCLESNHDVYVTDGSRAKEYIEKVKADIQAAHGLLQSKSGSQIDSTEADAEHDISGRLHRALAADQERLSSNRERALAALNRAFDEAEQELQRHYETLRQHLIPEQQSTLMTGKALRDSLNHAVLYSQVLLQTADIGVILDQHALLLAGMQMLADRAGRQPTAAAKEELLQPIVLNLDGSSLDAFIAKHIRALVKPGHGSQPSSTSPRASSSHVESPNHSTDGSQPSSTNPRASSSHVESPNHSTDAQSVLDDNSRRPVDGSAPLHDGHAGKAPPSDSTCPDELEDGGGIGLGDAVRTLAVQGNLRDVALTADGRVLLADAEKGLRQYGVDGKKLTTWLAPKPDQRAKAGVVSTVCTLDDGRVAVGIISNSCVVLLRQSSAAVADGTSDRWVEDREIKLRAGPYHVASLGGVLAVAIARSDEKKLDLGVLSAVVGSQWGPGPQVDLMAVGDGGASGAKAAGHGLTVAYNVVAVLLTATAVVVCSDERLKTESGRWCHVVDAFARDGDASPGAPTAGRRRLWRYECDEHVHDLCAATGSAASFVYAVLPESRRVMAIDGSSGQWLVDVLSSSQAPAKPLRIALSRRAGGKASLAVLYKDSAVTVHPVGGCD